jgi:putative glutamine amidotransferase
MKPRIAIPYPHSSNTSFSEKSLPQYCQAVERAGGEPVQIGLDLPNPEVMSLAISCDGVLLPGSPADVNPEKYGAPRDPHTAPADPARDNADELLLQDAFNMRKPVFGICFGLQMLNVWRTGTLVQHLSGTVKHSEKGSIAPVHCVVLAPESRLAAIIRRALASSKEEALHNAPLEIGVNSSHHQATAAPGDGLRPVAWCPDDQVIEALEGIWPEHWILAVQWHPERMTEDPAAQALFRAFVDAAREFHTHPRATAADFESVSTAPDRRLI